MSILDWTNFNGDIIVLTDQDFLTSDLKMLTNKVRIINIFTKFPELQGKINDKFNIFCTKPLISQVVDITEYGYILYLDADVLVKYQHFNELLSFWGSCGKIQISHNGKWNVSRNIPNTGADVLTDEEKIKHANFGVCAGVVGFPGNSLGVSFCKNWWKYNLEGNLQKDDQGNLTALMIREHSNDYKYIDFINTKNTKIDNISHYHTKKKCIFWDHAKFLLRKYETKENRHVGRWAMSKPGEQLNNIWDFTETMVFVDTPSLTGQIQHTAFGTFIWWSNLDGLEKIKFSNENMVYGDSFRGGEDCFSLQRT